MNTQETEIITPFEVQETTRRERHSIDTKDTLYRQMRVTMEAMEPNKLKAFFVPVNGHKATKLVRFARHIEESLNLLMPEAIRDKNPRIYTARIIRDADKKDVGVKVFRDQ